MTAAADLDTYSEALFVSDLQRSGFPSGHEVRTTVHYLLYRRDRAGCAAAVAAEFGAHPEAACERMRWARTAVAEAFDFEPAGV